MFEIELRNNKKFLCDENSTIFEAAKASGVFLEHSCLSARCRSCVVKITSGETINLNEELVLSPLEKKQNFVLSCNAKPLSNLVLDIEDLGNIELFDKKIVPAKINSIEKIAPDIIKVILRLPPNANFRFNSGQYVSLIKGELNRSYSIANKFSENNQLEFFIKKYKNGLMSKYWFEEAKENDLLRVEGPIGSFFLRNSKVKNIIFLATGTGVAPVKSILENILESSNLYKEHIFWVFVGARIETDLFWSPNDLNSELKINYVPVLSKANDDWRGERGYVQNALLKQSIALENAEVYACGSIEMITSAKKLLIENSLKENQFYSDAFVATN